MPMPAEIKNFKSTHWGTAILAVCVIVFSLTVLFVTLKEKEDSSAPLTVSLKSESTVLKVGQKAIINVYFSGLNASRVLGADLRLKYDPAVIKVTSAEFGPYYNQPLVVKWDQAKNIYALASNPQVKQTLNPMLSVAKFEITALKSSDKAEVSFDPKTLIYIEKKGEADLTLQPADFVIQK